ncbi:MAG: RNA polymerase sigma factor [Povalibacter sp.]
MTPEHTLLSDLFRHEAGRLTAILTKRVGAARLDIVEDAVQDALLSAMRTWPLQGIPANPAGWLHVAARNALADRFRRSRFEVPGDMHVEQAEQADTRFSSESALQDELLNLIAYCCHPALSASAQMALTLRLACGLGVNEIAGALLSTPQSIAQRIVRAKRELRELAVSFELPSPSELAERRLPTILQAIYLLFDAGYLSVHHEQWSRPTLCTDALRLSRLLAAHPATDEAQTHALAALLHFSAARLPARMSDEGKPVPLAQQDRSKWDRALIELGFRHFDASIGGTSISRYHIEAAIAATHARATSFEETDWMQILAHYDALDEFFPSPVVSLNRIIALRYARGAHVAMDEFVGTDSLRTLQESLLYQATLGELHAALGNDPAAAHAYLTAADLAGNDELAELFRQRARNCSKP